MSIDPVSQGPSFQSRAEQDLGGKQVKHLNEDTKTTFKEKLEKAGDAVKTVKGAMDKTLEKAVDEATKKAGRPLTPDEIQNVIAKTKLEAQTFLKNLK